jgi:predicted TIM-barrel fold metal-dependent hydrolase
MPIFDGQAANAALRTYEDFLYRYMFVRAGALERPMIIHSAAALSPHLSAENNDPRGLYDLFRDESMLAAGTRFVVLHGGYPSHHVLASFASQFPNVFVDVSFFSKYPGVLEQIYRVFLAIAPSSKLMHGSDANTIPEEIGYCASNSRMTLARVLSDYTAYYDWSADDVEKIASDVLHRTARSLFRVSG